MKINILTENATMAGRGLNYPLKKNINRLRERGLSLEFIWNNVFSDHLYDCDILFVNSKVFRTWWSTRKEEMLERFESYRSRIGRVFYFDTTDSSGTLQTELLSFVSRYFKSFLLKDSSLYLKSFYGGRIFTDYYYHKFGVKDTNEIPAELCCPAEEGDLAKLGISWNSALSFGRDWKYKYRNFFRSRFVAPSQTRPVDLTCRMSLSHKRETIRYQRKRMAELLSDFNVPTERVSKKEYFAELKRAKIAVSPFGWGEFAYRDFEIFKSGCLLLKPDMSHISTWPDLYVEEETYALFSWDFSDFKEVVLELLSNPLKVKEIAENGQNRYRWFVESDKARDLFCDHVAAMVAGF